MAEAIVCHGASGPFADFTKYSMAVQQNKKQSVRRWEWQQLSQNFQRALWPKKIGWGNKIFRYILGKLFFANIGLYSFSFKFRVKVFNFIQLTHHFIIKSRRLNLRHNCPKICNFAQKLGAVAWAWVLLNYYRTLQSIIFYFNIFSFCK